MLLASYRSPFVLEVYVLSSIAPSSNNYYICIHLAPTYCISKSLTLQHSTLQNHVWHGCPTSELARVAHTCGIIRFYTTREQWEIETQAVAMNATGHVFVCLGHKLDKTACVIANTQSCPHFFLLLLQVNHWMWWEGVYSVLEKMHSSVHNLEQYFEAN